MKDCRYIFISDLKDRRMRVGDHILAIGDVNLRGMTSEQVAHVLRSQTGPSVRMILGRAIDPQSVSDDVPGCAIIPTRMLPDMTEVRRRLALAAAIQDAEVMIFLSASLFIPFVPDVCLSAFMSDPTIRVHVF